MSDIEEKVAQKKGAAPKGRSPSYPGVDLGAAIQRAEQVYQHERSHAAHYDTIVRHWGYSPKAGPGRVTFAALKKFGLLIEEGSGTARRGRLSDLALQIIQDQRPNSAERLEAIQRAALMPPIHRELWDTYQGALPSDDNLRYTLLRERNFTETGAGEFIQQFRATIAFARLDERASMPRMDGGKRQTPPGPGTGRDSSTLLEEPPDPRAQSMPLPIAPGEYAVIQGAFPFTEEKWEQMLLVLQAMKPALVVKQAPVQPGSFADVHDSEPDEDLEPDEDE